MASTVRSHRANQGSIPCIGVLIFLCPMGTCFEILLSLHAYIYIYQFWCFYSVK